MGIGVGRGKLLLLGEHAAVYGAPAVGFTLPWTLEAQSWPAPAWDLASLGTHETLVRALIERLDTAAVALGLPPTTPCGFTLTSQIPLSSGFGSSGALCAALVNLFWPEATTDQKDMLAWQGEGLFHGTPSGIDTALALRQGWWALDTGSRPVKARSLPTPKLTLLVGALQRHSDTKALVSGIRERMQSGESQVLGAIAALAEASRQAIMCLDQSQPEALIPLIKNARHGLRALGLESPEMTTILDYALSSCGAVAGKLSGAGGGGAFLLVFSDRKAAEEALSRLASQAPAALWTQAPCLL